jgi:hypothetical protein
MRRSLGLDRFRRDSLALLASTSRTCISNAKLPAKLSTKGVTPVVSRERKKVRSCETLEGTSQRHHRDVDFASLESPHLRSHSSPPFTHVNLYYLNNVLHSRCLPIPPFDDPPYPSLRPSPLDFFGTIREPCNNE